MSQKGEVLALGVTAWNSGNLGARRINSSLLAEHVIGDVGATNPDVHLTTDGGAEDTIVLVAELLHSKPWSHRVDIVDASDIGDGAPRARKEFESWRRGVSLGVFVDLDCSNEDED